MPIPMSDIDAIEPCDPFCELDLSELVQLVLNPLHEKVWGDYIVTYDSVALAILEGRLNNTPSSLVDRSHMHPTLAQRYDTERIAYLVINKDETPISLEVGSIDVSISDGYHRLAAALYRGDKWINADYSGYVDRFRRTFKGKINARKERSDKIERSQTR